MLYSINGLAGLVDQLCEPFRVLLRLLNAALIALIVVTSVATLGISEADAATYVRVSYHGRSYYRYPYRYRGYYHYRGGVYRHRYYRYRSWHYY
jgi:hypothetical protein